MAGLFPPKPQGIFRLLDPGAGVGSLTAAVCDRFLNLPSPGHLEIHLFENDDEVLPFLCKTLTHCAEKLGEHGHSMIYETHVKDFILDAAATVFGAPHDAGIPPSNFIWNWMSGPYGSFSVPSRSIGSMKRTKLV